MWNCRRTLLSWTLLALAGCEPPPSLSGGPTHDTGVKVLLIGVDGATLALLEPFAKAGQLPHFQRLLEQGSAGVLESVDPMYSPALWTEILTGFPRQRHGITYFTVKDGDERPDRLVASTDRQSLALWNLTSHFQRSTGMIGFWATWPAEPVVGFLVSDRFARGRYTEWLGGRHDAHLTYPADLSRELAELIVDPADPDLKEFSRLVKMTNAEKQEFLAFQRPLHNHAFSVLKYAFSAQRTYENIALHLLQKGQPELLGIFLIANDPICHTFWHHFQPDAYGLPVTSKSRRLGAIIPAIYRHNDAVLGKLLQHVDPQTVVIVVSDHGFQPSGEKPKTIARNEFEELRKGALEKGQVTVGQTGIHHRNGLFLAAGGPIRGNVRLKAELADLTPTILALLGLPLARDLPGRILEEVLEEDFLQRFPVRYVDSYDPLVQRAKLAPDATLDESLQLEQLRALGYIR
jgi:hypothetical protein